MRKNASLCNDWLFRLERVEERKKGRGGVEAYWCIGIVDKYRLGETNKTGAANLSVERHD